MLPLFQALSHTVALNGYQRSLAATAHLARAWSCVAESLCVCQRAPHASSPLLRALLAALPPAPPAPLADTASGTVRNCCLPYSLAEDRSNQVIFN